LVRIAACNRFFCPIMRIAKGIIPFAEGFGGE